MSEDITYFDLDNNQISQRRNMPLLLNQQQTTPPFNAGFTYLLNLGSNAFYDELVSTQNVLENLTSSYMNPLLNNQIAEHRLFNGPIEDGTFSSARDITPWSTHIEDHRFFDGPMDVGTLSSTPAYNAFTYGYEAAPLPFGCNDANLHENGTFSQNHGSRPYYEEFMTGYDTDDVPSGLNENQYTTDSKNLTTEILDISRDQLFLSGIPNQRSCDNSKMIVQTSDRSKNEKQFFCIYCKRLYIKLPRHLEYVHKNEAEVAKLKDLDKGSPERLKILTQLRNKGMFDYNTNPKYNKGVLLTKRRPNIKFEKTADEFTTCAGCYGCYANTGVRHHTKKCTDNYLNGERSVLLLGRLVESRIHEIAGEKLAKTIFPKMKVDDVVKLIRFDWLVIVYGNKLCVKYTPHYQQDLIRAKLRLAGRMLMSIQLLRPEVRDFAALFQPKFYDSLLDAIRIIGKFNSVSSYFGAPSTAAACVTQIREVSEMLITEYIKKEDVEMQTKTENFLKVFNSDVGVSINRAVFITQAKMKRDRREMLPTTEDIKLLVAYLNRGRVTALGDLLNEFTYSNWLKLAEYTMASIIVFNRRRIGETQNILVTDFHHREYLDEQLYATLSEHDKEIAKKYSRMKVRGKKGRTVPVLLKPEITTCIELIIRHRCDCKVPAENEFLFGLPASVAKGIKVIDAGSLLRKFSVLCGAKEPQTLRGTKLRKHMATTCISLELQDNSISEVADFMGHHEKIHREYYRQNPLVREVVKMSKLLEIAQGSNDDDDDDNDEDAEETAEENDEKLADDDGAFMEEIRNTDRCTFDVDDVEASLVDEKTHKPADKPAATKPSKKKWKKWTEKEKAAAKKVFAIFFAKLKIPSVDCIKRQQILPEAAALNSRTHKEIKSWISNQLRKFKRDQTL